MNQPQPQLANLDNPAVTRVYRRLAPFYDKTFGKIAETALRVTTSRANELHGRLLEVGVGTGLALPRYKEELDVTGIDLSPDMLQRAHERAAKLGLTNIRALLEMDATRLTFADESFDIVVALYVMTVVPDPVKAMHELARVTRPGGGFSSAITLASRAGCAEQLKRGSATSPMSWDFVRNFHCRP